MIILFTVTPLYHHLAKYLQILNTHKFHNFKPIIAPKKLSFSNSSRSK